MIHHESLVVRCNKGTLYHQGTIHKERSPSHGRHTVRNGAYDYLQQTIGTFFQCTIVPAFIWS